jgi:hypothetical protein
VALQTIGTFDLSGIKEALDTVAPKLQEVGEHAIANAVTLEDAIAALHIPAQ